MGMDKNQKLIIIVAVVLLGGYFLFSKFIRPNIYENIAEKQFEAATGGKADIDFDSGEGRFEIETEEGKMVIDSQGNLPADFPSDIEIYPGSDVTAYVSMDSEETVGFNTALSTSDSIEDGFNFYVNSLESNGWNVVSKASATDYSAVSATKDNRTVTIGITTDGDNTMIVITQSTT